MVVGAVARASVARYRQPQPAQPMATNSNYARKLAEALEPVELPKEERRVAAYRFTQDQCYAWANYLSPPRGWPYVFSNHDGCKAFIKSLAGRRVRLTEPAHPLELERLRAAGVEMLDGDPRGNAVKVRRQLGWEILGGYVLLELAQGEGRQDIPASGSFYHGEKHWWNCTPGGVWLDLTPRRHKKMVLVESSKVAVPPPTAEDAPAMTRPAELADEIRVEFALCGAVLPRVRLTDAQLDGCLADACVSAIEAHDRAAAKAAKKKGAREKGRPALAAVEPLLLRAVEVDGQLVRAAQTTPARAALVRSGQQVALRFFEPSSAEASLLRFVGMSLPRLEAAHVLPFTWSIKSLSLEQLAVFASLAAEHGPLAARELLLDGNGLADEGAKMLAELIRTGVLPALKTLVLHSNAIGDAGAIELVRALAGRAGGDGAAEMQGLDFSRNAIGERGLSALAAELEAGALRLKSEPDVRANASDAAEERVASAWREAARARREAAAAAAAAREAAEAAGPQAQEIS